MIKQVLIGGIPHTVQTRMDLASPDADDKFMWLNGRIAYQACKIYVEEDAPLAIQQATVIHESIHGMLHQAGMVEQPESVIVVLGFALRAFIRDNPELIEWLRSNPDVKGGHDATMG